MTSRSSQATATTATPTSTHAAALRQAATTAARTRRSSDQQPQDSSTRTTVPRAASAQPSQRPRNKLTQSQPPPPQHPQWSCPRARRSRHRPRHRHHRRCRRHRRPGTHLHTRRAALPARSIGALATSLEKRLQAHLRSSRCSRTHSARYALHVYYTFTLCAHMPCTHARAACVPAFFVDILVSA